MYARYALEHPADRAPHYAAVECHYCGDWNGLTYKDGTFSCEFCEDRPVWLSEVSITPAEFAKRRHLMDLEGLKVSPRRKRIVEIKEV